MCLWEGRSIIAHLKMIVRTVHDNVLLVLYFWLPLTLPIYSQRLQVERLLVAWEPGRA